MDKYEYKVRVDEIKALISEGAYDEALKIADSIDWRRVKSVMMLCTISDLYKINRRYEDSRDILLLAYERHTGGRLIVYSLCELSIKLGEYVQAVEYYKEFVQLAPKDSGKFILQYKLYEAQEVSLEERITVLEELKKFDYRERWAYELAMLYHKVGMETKCVSECDEMILMFGDGRYVLKALELKMQHTALSPDQQLIYNQMTQMSGNETNVFVEDESADQTSSVDEGEEDTEEEDGEEFSLPQNIMSESTQELPGKDLDIQVKTVDVSQYNTINLQKELAESMKEFLEESKAPAVPQNEDTDDLQITRVFEPVEGLDSQAHPALDEKKVMLRQDTDEMQLISEETLAENQKEMGSAQPYTASSMPSEEVFFGNTEEVNVEDVVSELASKNENRTPFAPIRTPDMTEVTPDSAEAYSNRQAISNTGVIKTFHKPSGYDNILSQEYDGQISLVVPEQEQVEKQITGQLSIEDIMAEWEKMKQENEKKRMEEIRKKVHLQTDTLFADFDESTKSGLLEELEKAMVSAAMKEEKIKADKERPKVVKISNMDTKEEIDENEEYKEDTDIEEDITDDSIEYDDSEEAEEENEVEETEEFDEAEETDDTDAKIEENIDKAAYKTGKESEENLQVTKEDVPEEHVSAEVTTDDVTKPKKRVKIEKPTMVETQMEETMTAPIPEREETGKIPTRELTESERTQFAPFLHHRKTRRQIVEAIDNISMASYAGNVVITGEEGTGTTALAKLLVKEVQLSDSNFSGKVAKISGSTMNKKDVAATLSKLSNGALIIEGAADMKAPTVETLIKELNQEEKGLIVLMEDTKPAITDFMGKYPKIQTLFNLRVDVEALDDQTLVKYAKKYALEQEYGIDELGILALHTRIANMQTSNHEVTLSEIEELVDEAIYYADRKTPKHFFDVVFGKRYDNEDMIILREKDFMHD